MTGRRPSDARTRAVSALREVLETGAPAKTVLAARSAGLAEEDRNLLRELVLGVLRWKTALDAEIDAISRVALSRLAPNLREILEVAIYQIRHLDRVPDYAAVDQAVRGARQSGGEGAAKFVNAVLRNVLRAPPSRAPEHGEDAASLGRRFSHPEFLVARWIDRFGLEATRAILEADNQPSALDLMVNPRKTDRDSLAARLLSDGIETKPLEASPLALTVVTGNPFRSPLFASGHFAVQDIGSQVLPLLLPPGETLIDLAAAPGGKSFAAIALGRVQGVISLDRSLARLRLFEENRVRFELREATPVVADFLHVPLPKGKFDRVLFDAPCSGTGTLRKNPEIRYRVTQQAIHRLAAAQRNGLLAAAALLCPGGYLLYSTCSLEQEENEDVVEGVLSADSGLEPAAIEAPAALAPLITGARFQMLPDPVADGFTAHLLRRR